MKILIVLFVLISVFSKAQVPVMGSINGATAVCSSPSTPTTFSTSASNSPTSYSWSVVPSSSVVITNSSNSTTPISFPYSSSAYTLYCSATNSIGTSVTSSSFEVSTLNSPIITFSPSSPQICSGSSTTVIASGADTYTWSNAATGNSLIVSPTITTTYSVTGTNSLTGCQSTNSVSVGIYTSLNISIGTNATSICNGQTVYFSAGVADSFSISASSSCNLTQTVSNHSCYGSISPTVTTTLYVTGSAWFTPCTGSDSLMVYVTSCLSLNNPTFNENKVITIYPNPTNSVINVEFVTLSGVEADKYKIEILNSLGQVIREEEVTFKENKAVIDTKGLENGVYVLKLQAFNSAQANKKQTIGKRFVIAR